MTREDDLERRVRNLERMVLSIIFSLNDDVPEIAGAKLNAIAKDLVESDPGDHIEDPFLEVRRG